ncbi:MAG TPA: hypothetical protein VFH73_26885, partial [Polyangia bacterium]|nr:hypothetical protein [Polyangia bacterium]
GWLTGRVSARAGLGTGAAILRALDLTLTRPQRPGLPPVVPLRVRGGAATSRASDPLALTLNVPALSFSDGTLAIRKLNGPFPLLGGQVTLDGRISVWDKTPSRLYPSPRIALTLAGTGIDLGRAGLRTLIGGRVTFRADMTGSLDNLGIRLTLPPTSPLLILGDRYTASGPIDLRLGQGELSIPSLHLDQAQEGRPGRINIHGDVGLRGRTALDLSISDHRLSVLPGLSGGGLPVRGLVDAELRLRGPPANLELGGTIKLQRVVLRGTPLGDGWLTFTPSGKRRVVVAGLLFQHFHVDGSIVDEADGPSILLGVDMRNAPLDPLLPTFPVLEAGRGVASGRVTMSLRAGKPAAFDGSFSELAISYAVRDGGAAGGAVSAARPRIAVRNSGPVNAHMDGWGDALVISQASFDLGGSGSPVRVAGRLDHGRLDVNVAGPLALEPLQPLVDALTGGAVPTLTGMVRADLKLVGPLASPIPQGQVAIARPVEIVTRQPLETKLRITGGAVALAGNTLRLDALTARLTTKLRTPQALFDGTIRADGRMTGLLPGTPPIFSGHALLTDASLTLPSMGETIRVPTAAFVGDGRVISIASLQATVGGGAVVIGGPGRQPATVAIASLQPFAVGAVDVPVTGRRVNWSAVGGLDVDELDFDLRLAGDARRVLTLSGDVRLVAGRYQTDVATPAAVKRPPPRPGARPPAARRPTLLDRIALDLRLRTVGDRFVIKRANFPALHLDLELHARGQASNPRIDAEAKATDLYGMLALFLYRLTK